MSQTTKTRLDWGNMVESSGRFPNSLADSSNLCPLVIRDGGRSENVGRWISIVVGIIDVGLTDLPKSGRGCVVPLAPGCAVPGIVLLNIHKYLHQVK